MLANQSNKSSSKKSNSASKKELQQVDVLRDSHHIESEGDLSEPGIDYHSSIIVSVNTSPLNLNSSHSNLF